MAIKRDYNCPKHGFFEAWEAVCPQGCMRGIKIAHLKAPALMSDRTKTTDRTAKGLAQDFAMSNVKSTREGEWQEGYATRNNAPVPEEARGQGVIWGSAGKYSVDSVLRGQAPITPARAGEGIGFAPNAMGDLRGPRTGSYIADHENLSVPKG